LPDTEDIFGQRAHTFFNENYFKKLTPVFQKTYPSQKSVQKSLKKFEKNNNKIYQTQTK